MSADIKRRSLIGVAAVAACFGLGLTTAWGQSPASTGSRQRARDRIVLLVDENKAIRSFPVVLAEHLGYLSHSDFTVTVMNIRDDVFHDKMLLDGRVDAVMAYHHHNIVNHSKGHPSQTIALLGTTPGMKLLIAPHAKNKFRNAKDLRGARIITGGANSSKTTVTNYLLMKAGIRVDEVTRLPAYEFSKSAELLKSAQADLIMAPNPEWTPFISQGVAEEFISFVTEDETRRHLGQVYPSNAVFMLRELIETRPEIAQHLADAFVKTLGYIQSHTAEELAAHIPQPIRSKYGKDYIEVLKAQIPMFRGNGLMSGEAAAGESASFGLLNEAYRAVPPELTYNNSFVSRALKSLT